MIKKIREITSYKDMVYGLVRRDLRGRYKGSFLGFLWNIVNPLFQIVIYAIVFSQIMRNDTPNYVAYLICGMMPWLFFSDAVRQGAGCIVAQADMAKKIYFPREVLPLSAVLSRFINLLITYTLVLLYVLIIGHGINPALLIYLIPALLFLLVFSQGFALLFSAINVYFRDVEHILGIILMAWMWVTPIIYEIDVMNGSPVEEIIHWNPLTYFIEPFQQILYYQVTPNFQHLGLCFIISLCTLIIGEFVFYKLSKNFAEEL